MRNDAYFEWRDASRIAADLTFEEIVDRVEQLESSREEYREKFDERDPSSVFVFANSDHDEAHDRMKDVGEWIGIERDIRLYELAHQIALNDGHLLPQSYRLMASQNR